VGSFTTGSIVLVRFPFSDLSHAKLRPAVVIADSGRGDWLLCQITSNSYSDPQAVEITDNDFRAGSLRIVSYARPLKLFTAHESLIATQLGLLREEAFGRILGAIIQAVKPKS
jgi:mRNA interferase MazF